MAAICDFGHTDKMDIKSISFDDKSNSVTISGPFDADKVCRKLCCRAGRVIKDMNIKGKDGGGDKPAEKEAAGKPEKAKDGKADKKEAGKAEKDGKAEKPAEKRDGKAEKPVEKKEAKAETKDAKPADKDKPKDAKPEKKVTFKDGAAPAADAKPVKAMPMADVGPLLEKMMAANKVGPEPPRGEPIAAQGVAVPSIWPAPASSVAGYGYTPSAYDPSYYGGGGYGGGCGCGYAAGYCQCGKPAAPAGGYYGVPVYDNQGWYYGGGRQPYYPQQQACCEDPNAGCSVM
jgi:hypothetical protein